MAGAFDRHIPRRDRDRLGALLRQARSEAGLQQRDLAGRLGVPQSVLSKMEAGERSVDVLELRAVCAALGLTLAAFVERLEAALGEHG